MALSVQENVRRCFEKFGAIVAHAAPTKSIKWRYPSHYQHTLAPTKDKKTGCSEDVSGPSLAV